eukprot:m.203955 g.203955  ORF g.203955 m.203955 type:complete len:1032 (+) comp39635_c0_seq4:772-3867(+)
MLCGEPPFMAQSFGQIVERTLNEEVMIPKTPEGWDLPSQDICNLISQLLTKDPRKRLSWPNLFFHPFWNGVFDCHVVSSPSVTPTPECPRENREIFTGSSRRTSTEEIRPQTAPDIHQSNAVFSLSARPMTAKPVGAVRLTESSARSRGPAGSSYPQPESLKKMEDLLYHSSDVTVTPIFGSNKIYKIPILKWEPKSLPFPAISVGDLKALNESALDAHIVAMEQSLMSGLGSRGVGSASNSPRQLSAGKGAAAAGSAVKLHVAAYMIQIAQDTDIANHIVNSSLIKGILTILKSSQSSDLKFRFCLVMGNLARNATLISQDLNLSEVLSVLAEVLRENMRNVVLKHALVASIGEYMFYIASEEEREGRPLPKWEIPQSAYSMLTRSLRDDDTPAVQYYAAKTIENMATTGKRHLESFVNQDVAVVLWNVFLKGKVDSLKVVALSALCRLSQHLPAIFQSLLERTGMKPMVNLLTSSQAKIQQIVVTLFSTLLAKDLSVRKILMNEDFLRNVTALLENPSQILRAKAYLTVGLSAQHSSETLLDCCQSRLISCIERDVRKLRKKESRGVEGLAYLSDCLNLTVSAIASVLPAVFEGISKCLGAVYGRKHPSNSQSRQIAINLPLLPVIDHVCGSSALLSSILNGVFLENLGDLVLYAASIAGGQTGLGSNPGLSADDICEYTFNVLSSCLSFFSSESVVGDHEETFTAKILPHLTQFLSTDNDRKVVAMNLIGESIQLVLTASTHEQQSSQLLDDFILNTLIPQLKNIPTESMVRPACLQLLLLLACSTFRWIPMIAVETELISSCLNVIEECVSNPQSLEAGVALRLLTCLSVSTDLDRHFLYSSGFFKTLTLVLKHLTNEMVSDKASKQQRSQDVGVLVNAIDFVAAELQFLSSCNCSDHSNDEQILYHKSLVECFPSLITLISAEETALAALCSIQVLLQIYTRECLAIIDDKSLDLLLQGFTLWKDEARLLALLKMFKEMAASSLFQLKSSRRQKLVRNLKEVLKKAEKSQSESIIQLIADIRKKVT